MYGWRPLAADERVQVANRNKLEVKPTIPTASLGYDDPAERGRTLVSEPNGCVGLGPAVSSRRCRLIAKVFLPGQDHKR